MSEIRVEPTVLNSVQDALDRVGQELGTSAWRVLDQDTIDRFAQATGDRQWIHVDAERAAKGPFGRCVAHGLLTLSLAGGGLFHEVVKVRSRLGVNYGCDRVRYPAPLPVDSHIRAKAQLIAAQPIDTDGVQLSVRITIEIDGAGKPACVADFITRYYF